MTKRRTLEPEEKAAAERAKSFWNRKRKREKLTQPDAAAALGMSTSAFNQYINGTIPLNTDITTKLASYLGVKPREIDPHWLRDDLRSDAEVELELQLLTQVTDSDQDMEAVRRVAATAPPSVALACARLFLDRVEAGL